MIYLFMSLLIAFAVVLILLILVQRGKGGGLAGAFGGLGGQSAFGTRAGDKATYITIWVAALWIILCLGSVWALGTGSGSRTRLGGSPAGSGQSESSGQGSSSGTGSAPAAPQDGGS